MVYCEFEYYLISADYGVLEVHVRAVIELGDD